MPSNFLPNASTKFCMDCKSEVSCFLEVKETVIVGDKKQTCYDAECPTLGVCVISSKGENSSYLQKHLSGCVFTLEIHWNDRVLTRN